MHIAVIGCGSIGGYLAGLAAQAGHDVTVLGRGRTAQVVAKNGLQLRDSSGQRQISVTVLDISDQKVVSLSTELVLLCVKTWQVPELIPQLSALVCEDTLVTTLQNGIGTSELVAAAVGDRHVLAGTLMIMAEQLGPGTFLRRGELLDLELGPICVRPHPKVQSAVAALASTGLHVKLVHDARHSLWRKLIFAAAVSGVPAMCGIPAGDATASPQVDDRIRAAIREGLAVAAAEGVTFSAAQVDQLIHDYVQLPPGMTSSMHRDIRSGRLNELSAQNGAIVEMGRRHGIPTPTHSAVVSSLTATIPKPV
ncbi:2-dehydropantoate 2-reductase [Mycobacteroides abscessus subsp. abscessus]|uniref:ketopantoate reductase family protein n=1 Tax=Mycobacteroides abscessus TaxID=36809 RepID=UPI0019D0D57B|nr:2-dehydropantoate 2-reductase [Mycobacteroides abscessus]MBN7438718.1 2-dehydropantoate 2-reductase [Mycobacteroides abscessus subsp. abscessus]